jgi:hypothetical protein
MSDPVTLLDEMMAEFLKTDHTGIQASSPPPTGYGQDLSKWPTTSESGSHWRNGEVLRKQAIAEIKGTTPPPTPTPPPVTPPPTPTPAPPTPPTSPTNPSGVAPTGDLPGWTKLLTDDFDIDHPLGSITDSGLPHWSMYPSSWHGTPTWGHYFPAKTISINKSILDIYMHQESINGVTDHLIAAMVAKINPDGSSNQLYGRYIARWRADSFAGYHASPLLWPASNTWPRDGEIDFPEGDFNGNIASFIHWQGGTSGGSQSGFSTGVKLGGSGWHTTDLTWLPGRVTLILDGTKIGELTDKSKIPNTPMHFVWQMGGSFGSAYPAGCGQGHMQMDWFCAYKPNGAT